VTRFLIDALATLALLGVGAVLAYRALVGRFLGR
jgi:hypothetical protein